MFGRSRAPIGCKKHGQSGPSIAADQAKKMEDARLIGRRMRILIAEDDRSVARFLAKGLQSEHYTVEVQSDGESALAQALEFEYDLLILDLNLPKLDGLSVLRRLREHKTALPVLILSGRSAVQERTLGLDSGADDYLAKPFSFQELAARVRALLRRGNRPLDAVLQVADLELSRLDRTVRRGGRLIELTSKEFALLEYLMRNAGRTLTRSLIVENVWNISFDTMTNVVDVYINYLRKKVDEGAAVKLIQTVRGVGYRLGVDGPEKPAKTSSKVFTGSSSPLAAASTHKSVPVELPAGEYV